MKKKINVLISCVGGLFIYDVIESLRKSKDFNIKIYGIDIDSFAYNKSLLDFFLKCPDVSKSEKKYKNWLKAAKVKFAKFNINNKKLVMLDNN